MKLREIIDALNTPSLNKGKKNLLDMEVRFHTKDFGDLELLSTYIDDTYLHVDIG